MRLPTLTDVPQFDLAVLRPADLFGELVRSGEFTTAVGCVSG
jgi:hypothetical protein